MFDRSLLKSNAKTALKRFYGMALLVMLIVSAISGIISNFTTTVDADDFSEATSTYMMEQTEEAYQDMMAEYQEMVTESTSSSWQSIVSLAFTLLVTNIIAVGQSRFYLRAREYPANVGDLFHGYKSNFGTNVLTMFCRDLFITLWSLLLIVPGIIKSFEYSMIPYILAENPNMSRKRAFQLSKAMTNGYKGELFVLNLSFIGWMLLGILTCGIGLFFLQPYIDATYAEAYTFLKARVLENGAATAEDFPGITE